MKIVFLLLSIATLQLSAGLKNLTLVNALTILEKSNLEVKVSRYEESMKKFDISKVNAKSFGTIDISVTAMRSNDPGNVFGFKVQSREASFADFGFDQFLSPLGGALMKANSGALTMQDLSNMSSILSIEPTKLNYPEARNHYITKATFKIPLFTGGMLNSYKQITTKLYEMSKLDTAKVLALKRFELKKAFYNVGLVNSYISNLYSIKKNIKKLERVIKEMQKEGYAVETDYLEVDAKVAEVAAMLNEAKLNKELAYQFISFLLNRDVDTVRAPRSAPTTPDITQEIVESRSLDIAKAKLGLKITKDAEGVEKAKFLPKIGAFAEYGYADNRLVPTKISQKDFYNVGVKASWNIFNGGADMASLEKAKLNRLKVATQVVLAKKGMWLKANKLKSEVRTFKSQVRSYQKQYRFSKKVYDTYKAKYKEGVVSITDLLVKQSKEIEVLLKLLEVKNKRNAKILELENLING